MTQPSVGLLRPRSIAPAARDWTRQNRAARLLHVFRHSCNLIDAQGRILSLVSEEIGDGPFNAVLPGGDYDFQAMLDLASPVTLGAGRLWLGRMELDFRSASLWNPRPDWEVLHSRRNLIRQRLRQWLEPTGSLSSILGSGPAMYRDSWQLRLDGASFDRSRDLSAALKDADESRLARAAERLAGLGQGLTPSGDDVLVGAMHAAWIMQGSPHAQRLAAIIVEAACSRTTSLSAACLQAAARGEASVRWHRFLRALLQGKPCALERTASAILATGHTSGVAAMQGFLTALLPNAWHCPDAEQVWPLPSRLAY